MSANLNRGVRGGTPVFDEPLCPTCQWGKYKRGASNKQVSLRCGIDAEVMKFEAYECSSYKDKRRNESSIYDLEPRAWVLVRNVEHELKWFEPAEALRLRMKGELKQTQVHGFVGVLEK